MYLARLLHLFYATPLAFMALGASLLLALSAAAQPTPYEPVLQLTGNLGSYSRTGLRLDLKALEQLPQHSFSTNTPWTRTPQTYTGPLLRDVLALAQANGTSIKATALNEYQVTIPVTDARTYDVIIAHRINGKAIPVRERGPFFIIYPFDSKPELKSARFYERSIWQLQSLQVN